MTSNPSAVAVADPGPTSMVDPEVAAAMRIRTQIETVKSVIAPDLNDQELQLFAMVAQRLHLDPFIRQIHAIKRQGKVTFQTGIDGFRASAEDTGEYRGSDLPEFGDIIDKPFPHPEWASVVVHRQYADGTWLHQNNKVWWDEFFPGAGPAGFMWQKMPRGQLSKCGEAGSFRKAFPKRFAGIYVPEEMDQADAGANARPVGGEPLTAREKVKAQRAKVEATVVRDDPAAEGTAGSEPDTATGSAKVAQGGEGGKADQSRSAASASDAGATPDVDVAAAVPARTDQPGVTPPSGVDGGPPPGAGLAATALRDWLRANVIGTSDAMKVGRQMFGDQLASFGDLTDAQRGELRDELARKES